MTRLAIPFLALLAIVTLVAWIDEVAPRADFTFASSGEVFTLDPQRMSYLSDMRMGYALYEGLVRWNLEDGSFEPAAAESWETGDDGKTWTFHLREDGRWSDGSPVTAHDFAWSWMRLLTPDTAADYSNLFFAIRGARTTWNARTDQLRAFGELTHGLSAGDAQLGWKEHEKRFYDDVGIDVVDERTLRIHLEQPVPWLLDLLAFAPASPVHRPSVEGWELDERQRAIATSEGWHAIDPPPWSNRSFVSLDETTGRLQQDHRWARPGHLVGNGPYLLETWRYKRDMRLRRSPTWQPLGDDDVRCETIAKITIEDPNTAVLAFESGEIDWLNGVNVDYRVDMIGQQQAGERRNIHVVPAFATDFFSFNCRPTLPGGLPNPFADPAARRGFAMAVDREMIVEHVTRLHEPTATTLVPRGSIPGYESPAGLSMDVERARRELASAGWTDRDGDGFIENERGDPFPTVSLLYTTNTPRFKRMAIALREQWERGLGVRIELTGKDTKFYKNDLREGNFMIARGTWYGDYGDPTTFLELCRSTDGNNDRGFVDERTDAALAAASLEQDPARRMELLSELERYLFEEAMPMIPICQVVDVHMYDPLRVHGLTRHPRQIQYLWRVDRLDATPVIASP